MILVNYVNFRDWKLLLAAAIQKQLMKNRYPICAEAWLDVLHYTCQKTVEDLNCILSDLEKFRTDVYPADQTKRKNSIEICLL